LQETLSVNLQDSPDRAIFVAIHIEDTDQPPGIVGDVLYELTLAPDHGIIHFVGAKPEDVPLFMDVWLKTAEKILNGNCNPIISAAVLSLAYGHCEKRNSFTGTVSIKSEKRPDVSVFGKK
jgi:hypothetical protein